jgi:hypothetical protein
LGFVNGQLAQAGKFWQDAMPTVRFEVNTPLAPESVLQALTDFSDRRPQLFRNIDHTHFRMHGQGSDWADVTEGNVLAWERNRYDWDPAAGTVSVKTVESDSWAPGSRWQYSLHPLADGGTRIAVEVVRIPRTLRGRLIAIGLPLAGTRVLRADLQNLLARIAAHR